MDNPELDAYKKYVGENLGKMIELFAHISMDDFSKRITLAGLRDDDFTQAFCGLDLMMDDLVESGAKYRRIRDQLENQVKDRTEQLARTNEQLRQDIAERKKVEEALAGREKFLTEVFTSIQDPISVLDTSLTIVRVNASMERWFQGKMPITGKKCYCVYHSRETPCANCPSLRTIETGDASAEIVDKCDAGGNRVGWSEVNAFPWRDARTGALLGVIEHVRDITERVRLENELFKIKKLESLGVLAGGIAHDFNNILMGIVANVSLAAIKDPGDPAIPGLLSEVEKASMRASKLVRQLLTFSKGGAPVKEVVSVNDLIQEATGFCLSGTPVSHTLRLAPDLKPVEADKSQLDQVLNNLIINAAQAMPEGGSVEVVSENVFLAGPPEAAVRLGTFGKGEYVRISVRDTGAGIPRENLEKVFDPYFTTKKKGNGLGLSIVFSIVNRHRGAITVDSRPDKGTVFCVYLPVSAATRPSPPKAGNVLPAVPPGSRVLLLDDDPAVRMSIEKMLAHAGLEVFSTVSGEETVAAYTDAYASGKPYDLVIMDLTIPGGMGGREAVEKVREINPAALVVAASGYSKDPIMSDCRKYGFSGALSKPFQYNELLQALEIAWKTTMAGAKKTGRKTMPPSRSVFL